MKSTSTLENPYAEDPRYKEGLRCVRGGEALDAAVDFFSSLAQEW